MKRIRIFCLIQLYFFVLLVADSSICLLLRIMISHSNSNFGLYEIGNINEFDDYNVPNEIIDIAQIVLNSVVICFVVRIQKSEPKEVVVVQHIQPRPIPHLR